MAKTNEGITGDQCLKNEVDGDKEIDYREKTLSHIVCMG